MTRASGYARGEDDWYQETPECVDRFLDAERFSGVIWDPACGEGNIPKRCRIRGYETAGTDIRDRGYGDVRDFLKTPLSATDNIVTNPPFNLAQPFVERALDLARRKVAIVARLAFLESRARRPFFQSTPLARVWVHSSRVSMPPGGRDIPAKGGSVAYCWLVWERGHVGPPTLGWLP